MKYVQNLYKLFIIVVVLLLSFGKVYAQSDTGWIINSFSSKIEVSQDSVLDITEHIDVDFGDLQKHGIYRYIPLSYKSDTGQSYKLRFKLLSVTDGSLVNELPYELSGINTKTIKIGDPDVLVTGQQSYVIHYQIRRGIRFLDTDELYWNVTGNDWPVRIGTASAEVSFPDSAAGIKTQCYTGYTGSNAEDCQKETSKNTARFAAYNLLEGEGLTIVAGAPKGTLTPPSTESKVADFIFDNISYLVLILTLIIFYFVWRAKGRDPVGKKTIAPEFSPPDNLTPSMMGVLKDERADMLDISVGIIFLASKGFLNIKEIEKKGMFGGRDYEFIRKSSKAKLSPFEEKLLDAVFGTGDKKKLSELKNHFYVHIPALKDLLYEDAMKKGYFVEDPNVSRGKYFALGFLLPLGTIALLGFLTDSLVASVVSAILLVPFIIWFALAMPRKTAEGAEALRKTRGFRMFIYTAERYREKFNEDKNIFSKYLPYAMVFGITKKWAQAFKGLDVNEPSWYVGHGPFNALIFANAMDNATNNMGTSLASSPQSSGSSGFGGGFSGGGFGGGGGGSW